MAIYTDSKAGLGGQTPIGGGDTSWRRTEPLITPAQVVSRFLVGIPLMSGMKNPDTGKPDRITPEMLADYIEGAVADVETMCHLELMPVQITEKSPFHPQEFKSLGYIRLLHRPASSVESVQIVVSDGTPIFTFDLTWVETAQLHQGQINVMPFLLMLKNGSGGTTALQSGSAQGNAYLTLFGGSRWVPSLIQVVYTVGYKDGNMPRPVNNLIGTIVAMKVLSILAPTYARSQGSSLSIGGMSQSVSTPGPELFKLRLAELEKDRDMLVRKIKSSVGQSLFSGNV